MRIAVVGAPSCGKTATIEEVDARLKGMGVNSAVVAEYSREYVTATGLSQQPWEQLLMLFRQLAREELMVRNHDVVLTDTASWTFLAWALLQSGEKAKDREVVSEIQRICRITKYDKVYHARMTGPITPDGLRKAMSEDFRAQLERRIVGYMDLMGIPYVELPDDRPGRVNLIIKGVLDWLRSESR